MADWSTTPESPPPIVATGWWVTPPATVEDRGVGWFAELRPRADFTAVAVLDVQARARVQLAAVLAADGALGLAVSNQIHQAGVSLSAAGSLTAVLSNQRHTASGALSGSGALVNAAVARYLRAAALSGQGTLVSALVARYLRSAGLTGAGALAVLSQAGASANMAGDGALASGAVARYLLATGLSGSGTLASSAAQRYLLTGLLSGSGTLSATALAAYLRTGVLSGAGTLAGSVSARYLRSGALSGDGALTGVALAGYLRGASLDGSGTVTATVSNQVHNSGAGLSADGTVSTVAVQQFPRPTVLSGAGTLDVAAAITRAATAELSGSGTLTIARAVPPPSYKGAATNASTTVTLPSHQAGDLIIIFAYRLTQTTAGLTPPSQPSAGGTVPTFTTVSANSGSTFLTNRHSMRVSYAVATASNHTSGTWTNATNVTAVVLSGQAVSPIGGNAEASGGSGLTTPFAPSVTLQSANGSSALLHFFIGSAGGASTWSAAPAGYTARFAVDSTGTTTRALLLLTKNDTTSDGSVANGITTPNTSNRGFRAATVEILAP